MLNGQKGSAGGFNASVLFSIHSVRPTANHGDACGVQPLGWLLQLGRSENLSQVPELCMIGIALGQRHMAGSVERGQDERSDRPHPDRQ